MEKGNGKLENFFGQGCVVILAADGYGTSCSLLLKLMVRETCLGIHKALGMHSMVFLWSHWIQMGEKILEEKKKEMLRCHGNYSM